MKRLFYFLAISTFFITAFTSCDLFLTPTFSRSDLYGEWFRTSTISANAFEFIYFQTDGYGYTWDEGDGVYKDDLTYHGNGWFKWELNGEELTVTNLMENGGAEIPKVYTVTTLNGSEFAYKDNFGTTFRFSKNNRYTID